MTHAGKTGAMRSGFGFERRRKEANAVFGKGRRLLPETELSGLCANEGAYWFRRGRGDWNSGRMRLTSIKRATYKLKNNEKPVLLAA